MRQDDPPPVVFDDILAHRNPLYLRDTLRILAEEVDRLRDRVFELEEQIRR